MKRNLLLIGGNGAVGTHIQKALMNDEIRGKFDEVYVCDPSPQTCREIEVENIKYLEQPFESTTLSHFKQIVGDIGAVIDVSGINDPTLPTGCYIRDLEKQESILSRVEQLPHCRFVYTLMGIAFGNRKLFLLYINTWKPELVNFYNSGNMTCRTMYAMPFISQYTSTENLMSIIPRLVNAIDKNLNSMYLHPSEIKNNSWCNPNEFALEVLDSCQQKSRKISTTTTWILSTIELIQYTLMILRMSNRIETNFEFYLLQDTEPEISVTVPPRLEIDTQQQPLFDHIKSVVEYLIGDNEQ